MEPLTTSKVTPSGKGSPPRKTVVRRETALKERQPEESVSLSEAPTEKSTSSKPRPTKDVSQNATPAPKEPVSPFTDAPLLLSDETPGVKQVAAKSLAQITAEVEASTSQASRVSPERLPAAERTPARQSGLLRRVGHALLGMLTSNPLHKFQAEAQRINELESMAKELKTPADFQAKTRSFQDRLKKGESLEEIRAEAYAVAREAARQATGMRPYDCQVLGALAMDDGHVAEMRTGEGKTLTAVMPLYLNALAGKGAHLVTVNSTLAQRDAKEMGPAFELLGMKVGLVTEDMSRDQKRAGYNADITYTTDRALGFDFLRDRTAQSASQRVQREPFFALVDEVDEVMIDEAQTPLIISGAGEKAGSEYELFNKIVKDLVVGDDYHVDPKKHNAWLTDTGMAWVENELTLRELRQELQGADNPADRKAVQDKIEQRHEFGRLVRAEQSAFNAYRADQKTRPGLLARVKGAEWDEQDKAELEELKAAHLKAQAQRLEYAEKHPGFSLFDGENDHRYRYLSACVKAHGLFENGKQYMVEGDAVHIVDKNKGRTADGRRYNDGLHQALEAKEGVTVNPEQRTVASITYPNLFKKYPRLSGMSGTARTSDFEFNKLYNLSVVQIPTNEPVIRRDENDVVFRTLEEKYDALARDAAEDFFAGRPVLIGTLSVEHNQYVARKLTEAGVPTDSMQVLNAESVRGDKTRENAMIANAGRSGIITVATNMAGRGANIKPDLINYMELTRQVNEAQSNGKPTVITVRKEKEAQWLAKWIPGLEAKVVRADSDSWPQAGQVQIRYTKGVEAPRTLDDRASAGFNLFKGEDFPTGGLTVYGTERASSRRIDDQLIGRAGRQGAPGRSKFYLSLEDDLLRVYGSKLDGVLDLFSKPGEGISHGLLDRFILEAQSAVEQNAFAAREKTNKSDEVLEVQREAFFAYRDQLVTGERKPQDVFIDMVERGVAEGVFHHLPNKKTFRYGEIRQAASQAGDMLKFPINLPFLDPELGHGDKEKMSAVDLERELFDFGQRTSSRVLRQAGKTMPNLDTVLRSSLLETMNTSWGVHLSEMELLQKGVQWQTLAQKDPEVEFKLGAYDLFGDTVANLDAAVVSDLLVALDSYNRLLENAKASG